MLDLTPPLDTTTQWILIAGLAAAAIAGLAGAWTLRRSGRRYGAQRLRIAVVWLVALPAAAWALAIAVGWQLDPIASADWIAAREAGDAAPASAHIAGDHDPRTVAIVYGMGLGLALVVAAIYLLAVSPAGHDRAERMRARREQRREAEQRRQELARREAEREPTRAELRDEYPFPFDPPHNWPPDAELRHTIAVGTTGAGKSQIIRYAAFAARGRGEPMIVLDWGGELIRRLYRDDRDAMIAPHDARSVAWNPLSDIADEDDAREVAAALVPPGSTGKDDEWLGYARTWIDGVLAAAHNYYADTGEPIRNAELLASIISGEPDQIAEWLDPGHPVQPMLRDQSQMVANVRNIAASHVAPLRALDPDAHPGEWSLLTHIDLIASGEVTDDLFVPVVPDYVEAGTRLGRVVAHFSVKRLLAQDEDEDRRVWLLVDELGQYPQMDAIARATTLGRKYGLATVASVQAVAQLQKTYTREGAVTLLANFGNKCLFRVGDDETAEWSSKQAGDIERTYTTTSVSEAERNHYDFNDWMVDRPRTLTTESTSEHRDRVRQYMPRVFLHELDDLWMLYKHARMRDFSRLYVHPAPVPDPTHPAIVKRSRARGPVRAAATVEPASAQIEADAPAAPEHDTDAHADLPEPPAPPDPPAGDPQQPEEDRQ